MVFLGNRLVVNRSNNVDNIIKNQHTRNKSKRNKTITHIQSSGVFLRDHSIHKVYNTIQ